MSLKEYSLKITQLARYAPLMVDNNRCRMSKFIFGVADSVVKEFRLMVHAQQTEEQTIKERERD